MRARAAIGLSIVSASLGAGLVACFDLFHSTAGIVTACQLDAEACADDAGDAGADGSPDFATWSRADAQRRAAYACAWLGACESPMGSNAFGACTFSARLAYDRAANPAHPPSGEELALWECLWQVNSCAAVDRCVFPHGAPTCGSPGNFTSCASLGGFAENRDVRIECTDGGVAHGENCGLRGQTCAATGATGVCAGAAGDAGALACQTSGCNGSRLHWCVDGGDVGIDCASSGTGTCSGFPTFSSAQWVACGAVGDAGCAPDASAQCTSSGVASSCPSGVAESLDCAALLGMPLSSCVPGPLAAPFDWTSPCAVAPASCAADSCTGYLLTGCARGASFTVDCHAQGLGLCQMVATDVGTQVHAGCSPP